MNWFGSQVFQTIEYIGEGVVSVLGLDESRYQDVLDNMTETELQHAQQVHEEREAENRLHQLTLEARRDTIGGDVESASVVEVVPVVEMTTVVQSSPQVEVEVEDMEERKEKETNTEEGGGGSEDVVVSESDVVIVPHVV